MTDFPIETQAAFAITAGLCAWLIGALMREIAHKPWEAWLGRILVGVAFLQLAAFAGRTANQVEFLQFVQKGERAHDTGDRVIEWATGKGHEFRFDGGRQSTSGIGYSTTMLPAMGRVDGSQRACGCCNRCAGGTCNCNEGLCFEPQQTSSAMASTSPRRRVCICEQCTCDPCICGELQAAANR